MMKLIGIAIAAATLTAVPASAWNALKADIPFEFRAGRAVVPAGHYRISPGPAKDTVAIANQRGAVVGVVIVRSVGRSPANATPSLTFLVDGQRRLLASVSNGISVSEIAHSSLNKVRASGKPLQYAVIHVRAAD